MSRPALLLAALTLACLPVREVDESTSSSGDGSTSTAPGSSSSETGEASTGDSSSGDELTTSGSSTGEALTSDGSSSSGAVTTGGPVCGDGLVEGAETCDDGQATALCDDDCTPAACGDAKVNAAAGEACDDGNLDDGDACIDCVAAVCGDGRLQVGAEECDDGDADPGDGCDEICGRERWAHVGVAKDIPVADLHLWKECWSETYEGKSPVADVAAACDGDHIMVACREVGSQTLTLAAHAPRADVFFEPQVDVDAGERHEANGVAWYWAPYYGLTGFGPGGNTASCFLDGQNEQLCWRVSGSQTFNPGRRCGPAGNMSVADTTQWGRVVLQAWD